MRVWTTNRPGGWNSKLPFRRASPRMVRPVGRTPAQNCWQTPGSRDLCEEVGRLVVQHRLFRLEEVDPSIGVRGLVGEPVLADQTGNLGESGSDLVTDRLVFRSSDALQVEIDDQDVHFVSPCVGACDESESG